MVKVTSPARGQLNKESDFSLSPCAPENLASRDGFGHPVPYHPAHFSHSNRAESGSSPRDFSRFPRRRPLVIPPSGDSRHYLGTRIAFVFERRI